MKYAIKLTDIKSGRVGWVTGDKGGVRTFKTKKAGQDYLDSLIDSQLYHWDGLKIQIERLDEC